MASTATSVPDVFAPLQALRAWLQTRSAPAPRSAPAASVVQPHRASWRPRMTPVQRRPASPVVTRPPLRVHTGEHGRLVISGRMADVCAELDRLAAQEARKR
jgi:hypothetical protein